jgi:hypothetical protein
MYSKSPLTATAVLAMLAMLLLAACSGLVPWHNEPVGEEVNLVFSLEKNLVVLPSATIDGRSGRFLFGSAAPRTLVDPKFARPGARASARTAGPHTLQLNDKTALRMEPVDIDLRGVADAIIGGEVWGAHAVTLDYRSGVLTYQKEGIHPELMTIYDFSTEPMVNVTIDGRSLSAVVDTASPDTLILPRGNERPGRRMAHVQVAGTDFGNVDVDLADVTTARIGNRLLSKFLVTIDYGQHRVGMWRDPRIAK